MRCNGTTVAGDEPVLAGELPAAGRSQRPSIGQVTRALVALGREGRRLRHWPSVMQIRAMAELDGREPCSYLLDRAVNWVPPADELLGGLEEQLGRHGLCFSCVLPTGHNAEVVVFPSGTGFDLL